MDFNNRHLISKLVFLGILLGIFSVFLFEMFVAGIVIAVILFYISSRCTSDERRFVLLTLSLGLGLRIIVAFLYYYLYLLPGNMDFLGPDGEGYQARGWYISRFLLNQNIYIVPSREQIFTGYPTMVEFYKSKLPILTDYQVGIFSYLIAFVYATFSYAPLLIKFANAIFSALTALIIYQLAKDLFGKSVGKLSLLAVMFLPSLFIFSLTSMKDPLVIFLLAIFILLLTKYHRYNKMSFFISAGFIAIIIYLFRESLLPQLSFVLSASLFFSIRVKLNKKILFLLIVTLVIFSSGFKYNLLRHFDIAKIANPHMGYVNTAGNNYKIFPEAYYNYQKDIRQITPFELAISFAKGTFHYLFEPFPFRIKTKGEVFAILQTLLWIIIFPFVLLGILQTIRYRYQQAKYIPVISYLLIASAVMAIGEGNVGTVFRHRDTVMPFFIIFGVAGIINFFGRKELP